MHVEVGVAIGVVAHVVEHLGGGVVLGVGEELGDHQAARHVRVVLGKQAGIFRRFGLHRREHFFRVRFVEAAQNVRGLVALHLAQDGRGILSRQIFQQLNGLRVGYLLDQICRNFGIQQLEYLIE